MYYFRLKKLALYLHIAKRTVIKNAITKKLRYLRIGAFTILKVFYVIS